MEIIYSLHSDIYSLSHANVKCPRLVKKKKKSHRNLLCFQMVSSIIQLIVVISGQHLSGTHCRDFLTLEIITQPFLIRLNSLSVHVIKETGGEESRNL